MIMTTCISLKVIKDSTTPKHNIKIIFFNNGLKVIKDSTTPKLQELKESEELSLKVIKDSTTPKPSNTFQY